MALISSELLFIIRMQLKKGNSPTKSQNYRTKATHSNTTAAAFGVEKKISSGILIDASGNWALERIWNSLEGKSLMAVLIHSLHQIVKFFVKSWNRYCFQPKFLQFILFKKKISADILIDASGNWDLERIWNSLEGKSFMAVLIVCIKQWSFLSNHEIVIVFTQSSCSLFY